MISIWIAVFLLSIYVFIVAFNSTDICRWQRRVTLRLYDPATSFSTVTPIYSKFYEHKMYIESNSAPLDNSLFKNFTPHFSIDDSEEISKKNDLACRPSNFGYSKINGEIIFPNYTYPLCKDKSGSSTPNLTLDYSSNIMTMSCSSGTPYYILEPKEKKGRLNQYHEIIDFLKVIKYEGPVKLTTEEFVYGSCDGRTFNSALHIPRFKPELYEKVSKIQNELKVKHKPLIVLILTVDSFSRRHFFRKLPKTIEYLNSIDPSFFVVDFKLHNVVGASSVDNSVPIFSDIPLSISEVPREYDVLKEDSIWSYFSSRGYVTLMGLEDCDYYFPNAIGRYPEIDVNVRTFYCAAKAYLDLNTEIDSKPIQRCIGNHMSHYYTLNFTYEFTRIYSKLNQWIYLHLNPAHEASGQHANTLDRDLVDFLKRYFEEFSKDYEIAVFLHADHGMRYGNWYKDIEAYQENKLPVFFFIGSRSLIDRIPGSYDNLLGNSVRLTTKKDLRPTIYYLADMPYTSPKKFEAKNGVNLFLEKSSLGRDCETLGISSFDCSCLVLKEVEKYWESQELMGLIMHIIDAAIKKINNEVHTPLVGSYKLCRKLSFRTILNVYGLALNNKIEEIQIKFGVNENIAAVFEVFAFVGTHERSTVLLASSYRGTIENYVYRGHRARIKIFGIKRKDKYAGNCEFVSRELKIKSEYCICDQGLLNFYMNN